jgi:hypothetical protein
VQGLESSLADTKALLAKGSAGVATAELQSSIDAITAQAAKVTASAGSLSKPSGGGRPTRGK